MLEREALELEGKQMLQAIAKRREQEKIGRYKEAGRRQKTIRPSHESQRRSY